MKKKKVYLTIEQENRRGEIASRLWQISSEENDLRQELKDMGIKYDIFGKPEVEVVIKNSKRKMLKVI